MEQFRSGGAIRRARHHMVMGRIETRPHDKPYFTDQCPAILKRRSALAGHRDRAVDAAAGLVHVEARNRVTPNSARRNRADHVAMRSSASACEMSEGDGSGVAPAGLFTSLMP